MLHLNHKEILVALSVYGMEHLIRFSSSLLNSLIPTVSATIFYAYTAVQEKLSMKQNYNKLCECAAEHFTTLIWKTHI